MREDIVYRSGIGILGRVFLECHLLNGKDVIEGNNMVNCGGVANAVVSSGIGNRGRDKMARHFWCQEFLENMDSGY